MPTEEQGILYLGATPIGNLQDITLRVLDCLRTVDLVLAEDTRRTRVLMDHYQIDAPLLSYHQHNRSAREEKIMGRLNAGQKVALLSDAGMPVVSDPGASLVERARREKIPVVPLPGPSAVLAAFAAAGFAAERFVFWGFLDRQASKRRDELSALSREDKVSILFEAPHRLCRTLKDLYDYLGGRREVVIARELTKKFEEIRRAPLEEHLGYYRHHEPRGEITLVISGASPTPEQVLRAEVIPKVELLVRSGLKDKEAIKALAVLEGKPKREIYNLWVAYKKD